MLGKGELASSSLGHTTTPPPRRDESPATTVSIKSPKITVSFTARLIAQVKCPRTALSQTNGGMA